MSFLHTVDEADADGEVAAMYDEERRDDGFVSNSTKAFSLRPAAYAAWVQLVGAVSGGPGADLRRYELATLGAAVQLRSSYCSLAHGEKITKLFLPAEVVRDLVSDLARAAVDEQERAVVAFAAKVAADAGSVEEADVARLRELGLDDGQILDVVLAAAARCFFAKVLDATGTLPDAAFGDLQPRRLREALTVGRAIAER